VANVNHTCKKVLLGLIYVLKAFRSRGGILPLLSLHVGFWIEKWIYVPRVRVRVRVGWGCPDCAGWELGWIGVQSDSFRLG